jgi:uncharacterized protein (TIGR02996 family)
LYLEDITMDSDKKKFEEAIKADRYDGDLRLVFSDWLEENGLDDEAVVQRAWTKEKQQAEDWLRDFASKCGDTCVEVYGSGYYEDDVNNEGTEVYAPITYEIVIQAGWDSINEGYGFTQIGSERARDLLYEGDNRSKFWECWQLVTGHSVSEETKEVYAFGCSC